MDLYKKIKFKLKETFVFGLIRFSLFLKWPLLTALAFWLASSRLNPELKSDCTVLCLGRSVFVEDVNAMAAYSGRIKYVILWRTYLQKVFHYFIEINGPDKITQENYHIRNFGAQEKKNYYDYLKKILPWLRRFMGFNAILAGNFGYLDQQEVARLCQNANLPFIVLHKEGLVVKEDYDNLMNYIEGRKFMGAKLLLYNSTLKQAFIQAKVPGVRDDNTIVVGAPRLDFYFHGVGKSQNKQIVLFSFWPKEKFFFFKEGDGLKAIKKRADDFHKWVIEFALNHADYKVIIKTKLALHYLDYVNNIIKEKFKARASNLIITNSANARELIKGSLAVLGFHSTTLMEALMAKKIIISPDFSGLAEETPQDHFSAFHGLNNYISSYSEMEKIILNQKNHFTYGEDEKLEFLNSYLYKPDGRASFRAENEIIKSIT